MWAFCLEEVEVEAGLDDDEVVVELGGFITEAFACLAMVL